MPKGAKSAGFASMLLWRASVSTQLLWSTIRNSEARPPYECARSLTFMPATRRLQAYGSVPSGCRYTSFVLPKSRGALASAERPQRAGTIASSIAFLVREKKAAKDEWLRNHDKSLAEVASLPARHPMTLVVRCGFPLPTAVPRT